MCVLRCLLRLLVYCAVYFACSQGNMKALMAPAVASAASFPRLHIMWAHLAQWLVSVGGLRPPQQLAASAEAFTFTVEGEALLAEFWNTVVEEHLLDGTHEKRATGLLLFGAMVDGTCSGFTISCSLAP